MVFDIAQQIVRAGVVINVINHFYGVVRGRRRAQEARR
jgi:hypothetical protein